jgi:hypothetical protein
MFRLLLDPQGGDGNGAPTPAPVDLAAMLKNLLNEKHGGDPTALARDLLAKNQELEKDNRRYRAKIKDLGGKQPEEGGLVLSKDDAAKWPLYLALGEPDALKASLDSGSAAVAKLEGIGRAETFRKAALLGGYNPDVFADLADAKGLQIEFKQETRDGKAVEVALVRGEGDSRTPLGEFVESSFSHYLPALKQGQKPALRDRSQDGTPSRRPPFAPPEFDRAGRGDGDEERGLVPAAAYAT